jgi:hypothetical protein
MMPVHETAGEGAEASALAALAADCRLAGVERQVLLLRLSLLPAEYYRPHHGRLAESALERLARADRARLYRLPGRDLALCWRGDAGAAERDTVAALETLFAGAVAPLPRFAELVRRFMLPRDAERLAACIGGQPPAAPAVQKRPPLDVASLGRIERALASAEMSRFARRRPVCRRGAAGEWRLAWEKRFLSVAEVAENLAPESDLTADPWLFRRLTRTLDRRMLALLSAPGEIGRAPPFSINLNVESILSPAFLGFDAALPRALRGDVLLDLLPADMLTDASAFAFARDFTRARGYRLVVRGVTAALLPVLPLTALGLDFLQLRFSASLAGLPARVLAEAAPDPGRIVLCRVDTSAALEWGEAHGLRLFQGRAVIPEM